MGEFLGTNATRRISLCVVMQNLEAGGAERVSVTIVNYLDRRKFDVKVVVLSGDKGPLRSELPDDVTVTFLGKSKALRSIGDLIRLVNKTRPNVVFVNLSHVNLLISIFRSMLPASTVVIARETNVVSMNNREYALPVFWGWLFKLFYNRLDHMICQSEAMRTDLIKNFGVSPQKTSIIGNPTDIGRIRELAGRGTIARNDDCTIKMVAVGSLHSRKNFDGLLRALHLCTAKNITLEILGDGPERNRLDAMINDLGLAHRVRLKGFVSNPYPFIGNADALIITSIYEGLPNVVLEALALQTPVISTPAGGVCNELLVGRQGCVLSKDTSDQAIASAIESWIAGSPFEIAQDEVESFDARMVVRRFETLFASYLQ